MTDVVIGEACFGSYSTVAGVLADDWIDFSNWRKFVELIANELAMDREVLLRDVAAAKQLSESIAKAELELGVSQRFDTFVGEEEARGYLRGLLDEASTIRAKRALTKERRAEYRRARPEIMLRMIEAGTPYRCAAPGCEVRDDLTIDHRRPLSRGGGDGLDNLQFMCRSHNAEKGDRPSENQLAA